MTILLALLLALLAFFGVQASSQQLKAPIELRQRPEPALEPLRRITLDEEFHGSLSPAETAKLLGQAREVLAARLGPKYAVREAVAAPGEPMGISVFAREAGGYDNATLERLLTSTGTVDFAPFVEDADLAEAGTTFDEETASFEAWRRGREDSYLEDFNTIPAAEGGLPKGMRWVKSGVARPAFRLVKTSTQAKTRFTNDDLEKVRVTVDANGGAAIGFGIKGPRQAAFEAFTANLVDEKMAIIVGEEILTAPTLNGPLRTGGVITGGREGFREDECRDIVILMNHPLPGIYLRAER